MKREKIWVNDGNEVVEYEAVPTHSHSGRQPEYETASTMEDVSDYQGMQDAPVSGPDVLSDYQGMQEPSLAESPSPEPMAVQNDDTPEVAPLDVEVDDRKSRLHDSIRATARSLPGAASAYASDVASGARSLQGRASTAYEALSRRYAEAQPHLKGTYAMLANSLAAKPAAKRRTSQSSGRKRRDAGMKNSPNARPPKVRVVRGR